MRMQSLHISLPPERGRFDSVVSKIEDYARQHLVPESDIFKLVLTLDELVTNIINYGGLAPDSPPIEIHVSCKPEHITVRLEDSGDEFNPLTAPEPELETPLEKRKKRIGGMGIHIVKTCMEELRYSREDGKNILILTRHFSEEDNAQPKD